MNGSPSFWSSGWDCGAVIAVVVVIAPCGGNEVPDSDAVEGGRDVVHAETTATAATVPMRASFPATRLIVLGPYSEG